jgi:hypothetical protein
MVELRIVYSWDYHHERAHYRHDDAKYNSAEIEPLELVEKMCYDQGKNGNKDHFCQIRPVPVVTKQQVRQQQTT